MIKFTPIPIFSDNYVWVITHQDRQEAYIVDPGNGDPVLRFLAESGIKPLGILITHSHSDHIGGIDAITEDYDIPVFGPKCVSIPQISKPLRENDEIALWPHIMAKVIAVPGHLPEHLAYFVSNKEAHIQALFCGDALFSSGCGRIFDGTHSEFHNSLSKLNALPAETQVFCAHEYTLANIEFASHIEPENIALKNKLAACSELRKQDKPTLPSTIAIEQETNPFLRCHKQSIKTRVSDLTQTSVTSDEETFAALRKLKDTF